MTIVLTESELKKYINNIINEEVNEFNWASIAKYVPQIIKGAGQLVKGAKSGYGRYAKRKHDATAYQIAKRARENWLDFEDRNLGKNIADLNRPTNHERFGYNPSKSDKDDFGHPKRSTKFGIPSIDNNN